MDTMDDDIVALMGRRAYDMAGCTPSSVKVYLNGKRLPVNDFKSYIDLYLGPKQAADAIPRVFEKVGERWEVAVAASDDGFTQVSFVNSIHTSKGGTHVNHVADQVRSGALREPPLAPPPLSLCTYIICIYIYTYIYSYIYI